MMIRVDFIPKESCPREYSSDFVLGITGMHILETSALTDISGRPFWKLKSGGLLHNFCWMLGGVMSASRDEIYSRCWKAVSKQMVRNDMTRFLILLLDCMDGKIPENILEYISNFTPRENGFIPLFTSPKIIAPGLIYPISEVDGYSFAWVIPSNIKFGETNPFSNFHPIWRSSSDPEGQWRVCHRAYATKEACLVAAKVDIVDIDRSNLIVDVVKSYERILERPIAQDEFDGIEKELCPEDQTGIDTDFFEKFKPDATEGLFLPSKACRDRAEAARDAV